jgi:hypothetical protein
MIPYPVRDRGGGSTMGEEQGERVGPAKKLPYEKPALTWEEPLARQPSLMAGCQKVGGEPPDCLSNPSS